MSILENIKKENITKLHITLNYKNFIKLDKISKEKNISKSKLINKIIELI